MPKVGATGKSLTTDRGMYNQFIYVSVTPRGSSGGTGQKVMTIRGLQITLSGTPAISNARITGEPRVGNTIRVDYDFIANGSGQDNSLYQWYTWDQFAGQYREISGETGRSLYIKSSHQFFKDFKVSVTPRGTMGSQNTGSTAYPPPVDMMN